MAWKKIGAAWNTDKGGIKIVLDSDQTLEHGVPAILFENTYKKMDKHPDWNLCIRAEEDGEIPF